jgi:predicted CoA-binding protein
MSIPLDRARSFLDLKRIAMIGVSRAEKDFSRVLLRDLLARGYDVVPVNPGATEIEGRPCFGRIQDVRPPVAGALVLTSPRFTDEVLRDCVEAGVRRVWLHRGAGAGSATPTALTFCAEHGIEAVHDLCPFMVLPGTGLPHRVHRFFRRRGRPAGAASAPR